MANTANQSFEYVNDITGFRARQSLVVRLGGRLRRKQELLAALDAGLKFPGYFGYNWDALEECLCDLSWLDRQGGIVLVHKHLPLTDDGQRRIYLEILRHAQQVPNSPLRVIFPAFARVEIER